jgi:hypothetical protein
MTKALKRRKPILSNAEVVCPSVAFTRSTTFTDPLSTTKLVQRRLRWNFRNSSAPNLCTPLSSDVFSHSSCPLLFVPSHSVDHSWTCGSPALGHSFYAFFSFALQQRVRCMPTFLSRYLPSYQSCIRNLCHRYRITIAIFMSFSARGLSSIRSQIFCYTAISSAGIVGILPGYLIRTLHFQIFGDLAQLSSSDQFSGAGFQEYRLRKRQDGLRLDLHSLLGTHCGLFVSYFIHLPYLLSRALDSKLDLIFTFSLTTRHAMNSKHLRPIYPRPQHFWAAFL